MASFEIKDGVAIIPARTTEIPSKAFENSKELTTVVLPKSVKRIGSRAFFGCSSLTNIVISESVKRIGSRAFFGCSSLPSVFIPKNVTSIGEAVFGACTSLTSIVVEEGNPIYDSRDNCNAIIETATNTLIKGCSSPTSINIPSSVTTIGDWAFYKCI